MCQFDLIAFLLPSALADGFYKLLLSKALATFHFVCIKCLIQKKEPFLFQRTVPSLVFTHFTA